MTAGGFFFFFFFKSSDWAEGEGGDLRGGEQLTSVSVLV